MSKKKKEGERRNCMKKFHKAIKNKDFTTDPHQQIIVKELGLLQLQKKY